MKKVLKKCGAIVLWRSFVNQGNIATTAAQCLSGKFLAGWVFENLASAEEAGQRIAIGEIAR